MRSLEKLAPRPYEFQFDELLGWKPVRLRKAFGTVKAVGDSSFTRARRVLFLSRKRYLLFHAVYPRTLKQDVDRVLKFTEQELFPDVGSGGYFLGDRFLNGQNVVIPVFYLEEIPAAGGGFDVKAPAALYYQALLPGEVKDAVVAVELADLSWEVAVFLGGRFFDCFTVPCELPLSFDHYLERLPPGHRRFVLGGPGEMGRRGFEPLQVDEPALNVSAFCLRSGVIQGWPKSLSTRWNPLPAVVLGIAVALGLYGVWFQDLHRKYNRWQGKVRELEAYLLELKRQLEPYEALRKEVETLLAAKARLEQFEAQRVLPTKVLEVLTNITPRDTWLERFELKGRTVTIEGFAPSAEKYVKILSEAESFANVRLSGSVRRDPKTGRERFVISFEVK